MPTNVTPEYGAAERDYQQASTTEEKIRGLEKMLKLAPTHKGAESLRAEIKTKISKLKGKLLKEKEQQKKKGFSLAVKKEGAAQVVLVGPPNTGKTALLNALTEAKYETAPYPFTTTKPNLGGLNYQTVRLQLVDLPPLLEGGALKQTAYFSLIRNADLVLLVVEHLNQLPPLLKEFSDSHILLNKPRPLIRIKRTTTGGLTFIGEKLLQGNPEEVKKILREHNIASATIEIFSEVRLEDFFEVLDERLTYLPALAVLNKQETVQRVGRQDNLEVIPVSALKKINLELLKEKIWEKLGLIKIFTKEPGRPATRENPLTLKKGATVKEMAVFIHKDFLRKFNYARVWGKSAKHQGQIIGLDHHLEDNDVVEMHLK